MFAFKFFSYDLNRNIAGSKDLRNALAYEKVSKKLEQRTRYLFFALVFVTLPLAYITTVLLSFYKYFRSNYASESFQLTFFGWQVFFFAHQHLTNISNVSDKFLIPYDRFPYDWKTPINYSISVFFQLFTMYACGIIWVAMLMTFIGLCVFGIAFIDDIEVSFNEIIAAIPSSSIANRIILKKKFHDLIQFHADIIS